MCGFVLVGGAHASLGVVLQHVVEELLGCGFVFGQLFGRESDSRTHVLELKQHPVEKLHQ